MVKMCLQCRRPRFDPWVWKIPWRREWLPTPVFLPGEVRGQRSLAGYSPRGHKESHTTEQLTLSDCSKNLESPVLKYLWKHTLKFQLNRDRLVQEVILATQNIAPKSEVQPKKSPLRVIKVNFSKDRHFSLPQNPFSLILDSYET